MLSYTNPEWVFLYDTFSRSQISVTYGKDSLIYPITNLTNKPLVFKIISPLSGNTIPNQDAMFNIRAILSTTNIVEHQNGTTSSLVTRNDILLEKCNLIKHFANYSSYFKSFPELEKSFCYTPGKNNITLFGSYNERNKDSSQLTYYIN